MSTRGFFEHPPLPPTASPERPLVPLQKEQRRLSLLLLAAGACAQGWSPVPLLRLSLPNLETQDQTVFSLA